MLHAHMDSVVDVSGVWVGVCVPIESAGPLQSGRAVAPRLCFPITRNALTAQFITRLIAAPLNAMTPAVRADIATTRNGQAPKRPRHDWYGPRPIHSISNPGAMLIAGRISSLIPAPPADS